MAQSKRGSNLREQFIKRGVVTPSLAAMPRLQDKEASRQQAIAVRRAELHIGTSVVNKSPSSKG